MIWITLGVVAMFAMICMCVACDASCKIDKLKSELEHARQETRRNIIAANSSSVIVGTLLTTDLTRAEARKEIDDLIEKHNESVVEYNEVYKADLPGVERKC